MSRFLTFAELHQAEEQFPEDAHVACLLEAVTDWPTFNLQEPEELVTELRAELGVPLTYEALFQFAHGPNEPWKKEAVSSLLQLFEGGGHLPDQAIGLENVLDELTTSVRGRLR